MRILQEARQRIAEKSAAACGVLDRWVERRIGGVDRSDSPLVERFKPDAAAIEEAPISLSAFSALYAVLGLIVIAVLWSIFGQVDRIVVAQGRVVTTTPVIVMQPFTVSRVLKIHVRAGDHVRKGQSLVSFDPAFAQADQTSLSQRVRTLNAEIERIEAELAGKKTFKVPPDADAEQRTQAQLFAQRTQQFAAEMALRESRERQVMAQIDAGERSISGLRRQLELAHKVADIRRELQAKNAGSMLELMAAEKDEVDFDLRLKTTLADIDRLNHQRAEMVAERRAFLDQWRAELNQRLASVRQERAQAVETLNKAQRLADFTELTSPVDGVVLELADRSEGSVLREAETLITLVPDDAELNLEANVLSRDVGFISVGDPVRIKFEAYPFQQYGTLDGTLAVLSPDSLPVREGDRTNVVFRAQVRLNETVGSASETGIRVRPGLIATAEIKAGQRSIASYILDPIVATADESLREP